MRLQYDWLKLQCFKTYTQVAKALRFVQMTVCTALAEAILRAKFQNPVVPLFVKYHFFAYYGAFLIITGIGL